MAYSVVRFGVPLTAGVLAVFMAAACGSDEEGGGGNTGGGAGDDGGATGGTTGSGGGTSTGGATATGGAPALDAGELYTCTSEELNPAGSAAAGADCCSGMGTCTAPADLTSDEAAYAFGHDDCTETLSCAPKAISEFIDSGVLPTCETTIGTTTLEGRCLPKCFVLGDPASPNLNVGDCPPTFNGEDVLCTPCYNPIDGELTGACGRDGDVPVDPAPTPFAPCGIYADPMAEGGPGEPAGVCVAESLIVATGTSVTGIPQDTCPMGELCAPLNKVRDINTCFTHCEASVMALSFTGPGACVATYLVEAVMTGAAALIGQGGCPVGEMCAPCINPLDMSVSGACQN